ncbi:MAG: hypothetical protein JO257_13915 [Deltaproteobacteria bacterium]|nr:hypothetical protein [Deltaproteobacteria bacterium]
MRAFLVLIALASVAHADSDADALTAQGEQLARDGEYSRAIDAFKQADAKEHSAKHACLIGLAYTRRELWSQAEIWLDRCKARSNASDPLPDWFAAAQAQLADKLKGVDTAALAIDVSPPDTPALISVSSFPPDETFSPRTIHLVPGTYVITGSVPGQPVATETVTVKLGADNHVTLTFKQPEKVQPPPPPPPVVVSPHPRSSLPKYLLIGAGAAGTVGIVFHVLASGERSDLQHANDINDPNAWQAHSGPFERDRAIAISCYSAAVIAAGVGLWLRHGDEDAPAPTAAIVPGGAVVGFEVRR